MTAAADARNLFTLVRKSIDVRAVHSHVRKPFRFLLCGDQSLIAQLRAVLLSGHGEMTVPLEAAACLETVGMHTTVVTDPREIRAVIFLGHPGDCTNADFSPLVVLRVPILALTLDTQGVPAGPAAPPAPGMWDEYVVPSLDAPALRGRFFTHLVECAAGVEIAVGRNLPVLRETVAAKLTRDAANTALKVALASAVVDHIPLVGLVLGAVASAGDMVAITGIQVMLMLHIEAAYGRDPDLGRTWQLLPIIGGGFGWRTLARELVGFVPIAGIAIKGAIAYAGTIVVGEGVAFFHEHGDYMTKGQASALYDRTKADAMRIARDLIGRLRKKP
ncbi:MAG: hypothetical protein WCE97_06230 [Candidatus Cybelea sp.]